MAASGEERESSGISLIQAICNATDAIVFAIDDAGLIVAFNARAEQLFERSAGDVIGDSPTALFTEGSNASDQVATWAVTPGSYSPVIRRGDRAGGPTEAVVARARIEERYFHVVTLNPLEADPVSDQIPAPLFRDLVEAMEDAVAIVRGGKRVYVNPAYVSLFGYSSTADAMNDARHGRWHPEDSEERDAAGPGAGSLLPHRIVRPDGDIRMLEGTRSEVMFEGQIAAAIVLRDVTPRERALRDTTVDEARLGPMFERLSVGIAIVSPDRKIIEANPALCEMLGRSEPELQGTSFGTVFPTASQLAGREGSWRKMLDGEIDFIRSERQVVAPDLDLDWVRVSVFAVRDDSGALTHSIHTIEDITDRKAAEASREASDALWWQTFEQNQQGMALVDKERNIVEANPALAVMVSVPRTDLRGTWFGRFFPPPRIGVGDSVWDRMIKGELSSFENERPLVDSTSGVEWVSISTSAVRDESGAFLYGVRMVRDITSRKRAEAELRASEVQFRSLFEEAPFAIAMMDRSGGFYGGNPAWEAMFGYNMEEMRGHNSIDFLSPNHVRRGKGTLRKILEGELAFEEDEWLYRRKDGTDVWTTGRVSAVSDGVGGVSYVLLMLHDITERKWAEHQLLQSQARFAATIEQAPVGIALVGGDRGIMTVNPLFARLVGTDQASLIGTGFRSLFTPETREQGVDAWSQLLTGEIATYQQERRLARPAEGVEWVLIATSAVRDANDTFLYAVRTATDITERKRVEAEIRESEAQFRSLFEAASSGIVLIDAERAIFRVNPAMEAFLGYTTDELIGTHMSRYFSPGDASAPGSTEVSDVLRGQSERYTHETLYRRKDGTEVWGASIVSPVRGANGEVEFGLIILNDVTEQRRQAEEIANREAWFRAVFESGPFGLALIDEETRVIDANRQLELMFGYSRRDFVGKRMVEFNDPTYQRLHSRGTERLVAGETDQMTVPRRFARSDGTGFPAIVSTSAVRHPDGTFNFGVRAIQDITAQVQAQADLSESEARFRAMFESAPLGFAIVDDRDTLITDMNAELGILFGYEREEMIGHRLGEFRAEPLENLGREESQALASGAVDRLDNERLYRRKDGTQFDALVNTAAVRDDEGRYLYSVRTVQDITARKEIDRGKDEFIAMTSHELRTPVTAMHAAVTLVAQGVFGPMPEKAQAMLDIAASNSDRLVALVNDLIDLERMNLGKVDITPSDVNVGELALQASDLVRPLADASGVTIVVDPVESTISADPGRILQTLQNLLGNAIKFSPVSAQVTLMVADLGPTVEFRVIDQGKGIPADQLQMIFERFQQVESSDARGAGGTGLGLAIAKAIVERHRGRIWAESELGVGSTFVVQLPRS
jgi:PAS domain S-box-containing protein